MVDPAPGSGTHASRRERRAHRTRTRWRRVAAFTATAAIVIGVGLVATETVRLGGTERPSLAGTVSTTEQHATPSTTTTPVRPCRTPLTDAAPLRLWIGGDSLAGSLGPALGTIAGNTGVVQPQFDSRVSSGLTNPGFFDWPGHAAKEMTRLDPEVVVFIIGANDFAAPMNTTPDANGDPAWKATYTKLVDEMLSALDAEHRTVIWIGSPSFKDDRNTQIKQLDDLMGDVIAKHDGVVYVDDYKLFTDDDGKYAASLAPVDQPDATPVLVRAGDGVHLTPQGADRLAQTVFPLIDAQCKVTKQAAPGVVKSVIQTEGSTQVVSSGRGGTVQTTPPATSPPVTTQTTAAPVATSPPTTTAAPVESTTTTTVPPPTTSTVAQSGQGHS